MYKQKIFYKQDGHSIMYMQKGRMRHIEYISIVVLVANCSLMGISKKDKLFIEKYSLNKTLASKLNANKDRLLRLIEPTDEAAIQHPVWELPWLPHYLIKRDICRIEGMEKIRSCIETYSLDLITVPQKYIYHIPGRPQELNDSNYYIVEPKLAFKKNLPFTVLEVQQLQTIITHTGYSDLKKSNILRLENNQIAIIDTESSAFGEEPCIGLMRLITYSGGFDLYEDFTDEAFEYIILELRNCMPTEKTAYREGYKKLRESLTRRPEFFALFKKHFPRP